MVFLDYKEKDDKVKNGIKTYLWGESYWKNYQFSSNRLNQFHEETFRDFAKFFILSPRDLAPCLNCRRGFRQYIQLPEFDIEVFLNTRSLDKFTYLLHNKVNHKLNVETKKYSIVDESLKTISTDEAYVNCFWLWIEMIAFNYPADIDLLNRDFEGISKFEIGSSEDKELRQRMKTYILFFDLLKNYIDRNSPLHLRWTSAYFILTPSRFTFSSRTQLLKWIFEMQNLSGYNRHRSFITMMEQLHPCRSTHTHP